jgi:hypothetical protein
MRLNENKQMDKQIINTLKDTSAKIEYWKKDMDEVVAMMESHNESLRGLLKALQEIKNV